MSSSTSDVSFLLNLGPDTDENEWKVMFDGYMAAAPRSNEELIELLVFATGRNFYTLVKVLLEYCSINNTRNLIAIINGTAKGCLAGHHHGAEPALIAACRTGTTDLVELLLQYKADPNQKVDEDSESPLQTAIELPNVAMVEMLLGAGAKADATADTGTPLLFKSMMSSDNLDMHDEIITLLLNNGADANAVDWRGLTPLIFASRSGGNFDRVRCLLEHGADPNLHARGDTPLYFAGESGYAAIAQCLLEHGAHVNGKCSDDRTALFGACIDGHVDVMRVLVAHGADVNIRNVLGDKAIHMAAVHGRMDALHYLIDEAGADVHATCDYGATALMEAAKGGQLNAMEFFLERGLSIHTRDNAGSSALDRTCYHGEFEAFRWLQQRGADWASRDNEDGNSNLHIAVEEGHVTIARELLRLGADTRALNKAGETPYSKAKECLDSILLLVMHDAFLGRFG